jgi:hypothetical protein
MELQCCQFISVNSKPASEVNETVFVKPWEFMCSVMWCWVHLAFPCISKEHTASFRGWGIPDGQTLGTGGGIQVCWLGKNSKPLRGGADSNWWIELLEPSTHLLPGPFQGPYNLHNLFPISVTNRCLAPWTHIYYGPFWGPKIHTRHHPWFLTFSNWAIRSIPTHLFLTFDLHLGPLNPYRRRHYIFAKHWELCWSSHISVTSHETGNCHTTTVEASNLTW